MAKREPKIAVIGAGFSGMCVAIKLKQAGFQNITLFEKADKVGGTWRENTYPGVACDVPSHLYSFSFEPKPDWSHVFSPGAEIQSYCEHVAEKYDLLQHLKCGHELVSAKYDAGRWHLTFTNGYEECADFLISCIGGLHIPSFPSLKGVDLFKGATFHSAQWNHEYDLTGKRVAVIGTAASALQIIPEIVDKVAKLDVYQRTPNWVMPRPREAYSKGTKWLFGKLPFLAKLLRLWLYFLFEVRFPLFRGSAFFKKRAEKMALDHLEDQVKCPDLRRKLTPDYRVGCKRILASDSYFPALQKDNVTLITDGIEHLTESGVVCKEGIRRDVDAILYATGFKPFDVVSQMEVIGKEGQSLADYMAEGIRAHRTVAVPGFPNYFNMLGPNSGLGHNSIIIIIEAQAKYIVQAIEHMLKVGAESVEPRVDAADAYNEKLQADLKYTVWAGHCKSWYQDEKGHIYTLWPRGTISFRKELARLKPEEYAFE